LPYGFKGRLGIVRGKRLLYFIFQSPQKTLSNAQIIPRRSQIALQVSNIDTPRPHDPKAPFNPIGDPPHPGNGRTEPNHHTCKIFPDKHLSVLNQLFANFAGARGNLFSMQFNAVLDVCLPRLNALLNLSRLGSSSRLKGNKGLRGTDGS
jgi:hypothetical protein